jgi:crotonobetainyl-CoA:carnitine CoA-transferase CaiB-like acyl-CoA transferase
MGRMLEGLRVLDLGTRIAAPFCAGLLGEQGAEVIKIEQPDGGDPLRELGPFVETEEGPYSLFWAVEGRGRKSVTLDLRRPEGAALFRRLAEHADVVCENFRPGTLERWGLAPGTFPDRLVWVRISVFGQDGPKSLRPGLDRNGIAYGGLLHLTGDPDRPPVRPGITVSDYLTGTFAAQAALAALYARDARGTGKGAVIDACLTGSVLRILEWTIAAYDRLGVVRGRSGNQLEHSAPLDNFPTADGKYVCVVAAMEANYRRLCEAMGRPDLLTDERFSTAGARARHRDEINGIVAAWTSSMTAAEVEARCVAADVPVGTAYSAADIVADEHFAARGELVPVLEGRLGPVLQQAPFPRFDGERPVAPSGAPELGAHNEEIWCGLVGLSADELADHRAAGVI